MKTKRPLTIHDLAGFRAGHPNTPMTLAASRFGVSRQYIHELWNRHFPHMNYNAAWGKQITCFCRLCNREFPLSAKLVLKGEGKYCSRNCWRLRAKKA